MGWRTEGVGARRPVLRHRFRPVFCTHPFPMPPLQEGRHNSRGVFLAVSCQPLPPTPFFQTLTNHISTQPLPPTPFFQTLTNHISNSVPGFSRDFQGILFMCFPLPQTKMGRQKNEQCLAPTQSRDNPTKLFMFSGFSLSSNSPV